MSERSDAPERRDLYAMWKQLYDANEKAWSQATGELLESESFAQLQGRMLETFLAFQKTWKDSMTAQLQAANIATRDDVARLGELIVGLEEKVDQLADRLAETARPTVRAPRPVRAARAVGAPRKAKTRR